MSPIEVAEAVRRRLAAEIDDDRGVLLRLRDRIAGLRVATVSTIGIVTITAVIGLGGLGQLILKGLIESFHTPLVVATVLSVALALVADRGLAGVERLSVPWARRS